MRTFFFLIAILLVIVGAFYYLNRDLAFDLNNPYCLEVAEKMKDQEYRMSYGDRVKAVWNGCL
jgi:hypothetical protein